MLLQDGTAPLLHLLVRLLLDDLAAHHELERPLGALLLLESFGLHESLLTLGLDLLPVLELIAALVLQLHVGLDAPHDPLVALGLQIGKLCRLLLRLLLQDVRSPEVQGPHLVLASLRPVVLLLPLPLLVGLGLLLRIGRGDLARIGLLLPKRLHLTQTLDLLLLLVELLLSNLLLQLLPGLRLHLLPLLVRGPLVVELLHFPGIFL
mmetsp:Transcript_66931/g.217773  ORF Transcript_66931/g.217773 Transcript_66931/m.217773 type:complete len:207 (-) Transcript_66931:688-1308(-)